MAQFSQNTTSLKQFLLYLVAKSHKGNSIKHSSVAIEW